MFIKASRSDSRSLSPREKTDGKGLIGCETDRKYESFCSSQVGENSTAGSDAGKKKWINFFEANISSFLRLNFIMIFMMPSSDCFAAKALHSLINKVVLNVNCIFYPSEFGGKGKKKKNSKSIS